MFSYRHGFHAGNHADVLKHMVLVQLLAYLNQKDAAYMVIDTHAGAGVYQLDSDYASKSGEFETGIARLWGQEAVPDIVADYLQVIHAMNPSGRLRHYPGSPFIPSSGCESKIGCGCSSFIPPTSACSKITSANSKPIRLPTVFGITRVASV